MKKVKKKGDKGDDKGMELERGIDLYIHNLFIEGRLGDVRVRCCSGE